MPSILDRMATPLREFRPETTQEFFALQLARKLKDTANVRSYVALTERFSEETLIEAYREALSNQLGEGLAERFQLELRRLAGKEGYERTTEAGRF